MNKRRGRGDGSSAFRKYAIGLGIATAVSIFPMPYGYYMLLRLVFFVGAIWGIVIIRSRSIETTVFLCAAAILFNPVLPIHLGSKGLWVIANLALLATLWSIVERNEESADHDDEDQTDRVATLDSEDGIPTLTEVVTVPEDATETVSKFGSSEGADTGRQDK